MNVNINEFLKGKKTKIGLVLSVLMGLAQVWEIQADTKIVETVATLGMALIGYGVYDKIGRVEGKKK